MNSRPAWPANVKMGRKLTVISSSEKKIGRPTSLQASTMIRCRSAPGGAVAKPDVRVLDEHDGGIRQLADRDGDPAERHDVGREAEIPDGNERQQHRERQHDHDDERRSRVEQEHQADDRDDDRLLDERVGQGLDGPEDQFRPVVGGNEADAIGQAKRGNLRVECADDLQCIRADPHHHDAADRLPGAVPVRGTAANLRPVADRGHVAEPDGRAAGADRDHALLEILQVLDVAAPAQDVFATGELEHACADFRVGVADRPRDVRHRQPEAQPTDPDR